MLTFPLKAKESVTLTFGDLRRLVPKTGFKPACFSDDQLLLNDSLVDFHIRWLLTPRPKLPEQPALLQQLMPGLDASVQDRVHIFNSFFLKKLRQLTLEKKSLQPLLKWVRNVDVFSKDLLFVPVHELSASGHWALAIICFPGKVVQLRPKTEPVKEEEAAVKEEAAAAAKVEEVGDASSSSSSGSPPPSQGSPPRPPPPPPPVEAPCILFVDSWQTNENKALFSQLRHFLEFYWHDKYHESKQDGLDESGKGKHSEPLPLPTAEFGIPGPTRPTRQAPPPPEPKERRERRAKRGHATLEDVYDDDDALPLPLQQQPAAFGAVDDDVVEEISAPNGRPRRKAASAAVSNMDANLAEERKGRQMERQATHEKKRGTFTAGSSSSSSVVKEVSQIVENAPPGWEPVTHALRKMAKDGRTTYTTYKHPGYTKEARSIPEAWKMVEEAKSHKKAKINRFPGLAEDVESEKAAGVLSRGSRKRERTEEAAEEAEDVEAADKFYQQSCCPDGHWLDSDLADEDVTCDSCRGLIRKGDYSYFCKECDYDKCAKCYGAKEEEEPVAAVCNPVTAPMLEESPTSVVDGESEEEVEQEEVEQEEVFTDVRMQGDGEVAASLAALQAGDRSGESGEEA